LPTVAPSNIPSILPTVAPSNIPSILPSDTPTKLPSNPPSLFPTSKLVPMPSITPTSSPSFKPTQIINNHRTTHYPTKYTSLTRYPTLFPTKHPTYKFNLHYRLLHSGAECSKPDFKIPNKVSINKCWDICKDLAGVFIFGIKGTGLCDSDDKCVCKCETAIPIGESFCKQRRNPEFSLYKILAQIPVQMPTNLPTSLKPNNMPTYKPIDSSKLPIHHAFNSPPTIIKETKDNHHIVTIVGICVGTLSTVFLISIFMYYRRQTHRDNIRQFELVRIHRNNQNTVIPAPILTGHVENLNDNTIVRIDNSKLVQGISIDKSV